MINALRAWGPWPVLDELWRRLTANMWRVACLLALIGIGVDQVRIAGLTLHPHIGPVGVTLIDIEGYRPALASAQAQLAQIKAAQPVAAAAQGVVNHQPAVISAAIAKASNDDATMYYAKGRAAGAAYAVAHPDGGQSAGRLCAAPVDGIAGHASLPGADHPAPLDDRSGDAAGMVAVSRADFDQLAANSLRLAKMRQDADSLIAAGVAVGVAP